MFTGIITDIGEVSRVEMRGDMRARISCHYEMAGVDLGASISCDGICLTVVEKGTDGSITSSNVRLVHAEERTAEMARLLSGNPDSETALAHARELLEAAHAR